ncbi:MAG: hypothetical protein KDC07_00250 [Chitinophagaceae bacterium]|nr:hypothetical protein [Chitinophagaceae bacterium]MCB9044887.1 hypothetical protein [Chitinophagales bacterium]
MKKILTPILLMFLLQSTTSHAQEMYFRGGFGYATAHGGYVEGSVYAGFLNAVLPYNGSYSGYNLPTNTSETFDYKKASFSSGLQAILGLGLMLNKHIGVELAANLAMTTQQMESDVYLESPDLKTSINTKQHADQPVFITPAVVLQTGGKINAYARGGVVLPIQSGITQDVTYTEERYNEATNSYVTTTWNMIEQYKMRFNVGFSGAMGVKFKATKRLQAWAEAGIMSTTLYFKESVLAAYSENGQSLLNQVHPSQRTTKYERKGTNSGSMNTAPTSQVPFSNLNFCAGISVGI